MAVILPAAEVPGAAQESTSQDILAAVDGLEGSVTTLATEATATGIASELTTLNSTANNISTGVGSIITKIDNKMAGSFVNVAFDFMSYATGVTSDIYTFKSGGATGTTVKTLTIEFTGSDKGTISTVTAV